MEFGFYLQALLAILESQVKLKKDSETHDVLARWKNAGSAQKVEAYVSPMPIVLRSRPPAIKLARTDAVRAILLRELEELENDGHPGTKRA
jgi:hypothetical protein